MQTGNKYVDAIGMLPFTGNVTPNVWFQRPEFLYDTGKLNFLSIILLSEILYWYRPKEIRDEHTGKTLCYKPRFHDNKLQKSYSILADKFHCSKKQITDACHFLQERGLITLEFRTIHYTRYVDGGTEMGVLNNVLYIAPVVEGITKLLDIPLPPSGGTPPPLPQRNTPLAPRGILIQRLVVRV